MEEINIIYIDDNIETYLEKYLIKYASDNGYDYRGIIFKTEDTYEELLKNSDVKNSNIILIDSQLFENQSVKEKFTGEEFKLIIKKFCHILK